MPITVMVEADTKTLRVTGAYLHLVESFEITAFVNGMT